MEIFSEITPLSPKDCFYVVDRHKDHFDYPIHKHSDFELNFVMGAAGAHRIVGDNLSVIGDLDLALVGSEDLEHAWRQGNCTSTDIREITIQFHSDLFPKEQLGKNQFSSIAKMLENAKSGLSFPIDAILKVFPHLDALAHEENGFTQWLMLMQSLNILSQSNYSKLSSTSFARTATGSESRRVQKVKDYINANYSRDLTLDSLASLVGMAPNAFSRFFHQRTGKTLINYILDIRLGAAARALVDTTESIAEICYETGFNNLSNFNRAFRRIKGMTPKEFRQLYKKSKIIV